MLAKPAKQTMAVVAIVNILVFFANIGILYKGWEIDILNFKVNTKQIQKNKQDIEDIKHLQREHSRRIMEKLDNLACFHSDQKECAF